MWKKYGSLVRRDLPWGPAKRDPHWTHSMIECWPSLGRMMATADIVFHIGSGISKSCLTIGYYGINGQPEHKNWLTIVIYYVVDGQLVSKSCLAVIHFVIDSQPPAILHTTIDLREDWLQPLMTSCLLMVVSQEYLNLPHIEVIFVGMWNRISHKGLCCERLWSSVVWYKYLLLPLRELLSTSVSGLYPENKACYEVYCWKLHSCQHTITLESR